MNIGKQETRNTRNQKYQEKKRKNQKTGRLRDRMTGRP